MIDYQNEAVMITVINVMERMDISEEAAYKMVQKVAINRATNYYNNRTYVQPRSDR